MRILGIESSADETAAAVVENGRILLSNTVASSMDLHTAFGGVVPEIAARSHLETIMPVIDHALMDAFVSVNSNRKLGTSKKEPRKTNSQFLIPNSSDLWSQIDAIAVTQGPGLIGSLLIGVLTARTLAIAKKLPLIAINHVEAHVYANFLTETELPGYQLSPVPPEFPLLALIVSGGHSQLVLFEAHGRYRLLGQTADDAIGEAFDKVAKILGLPYPGGPSVAKAAEGGNPYAFEFPVARRRSQASHTDALQGEVEQRTEAYEKYVEGAAQTLTPQGAVSASGAASSAGRQVGAVRGLGKYDFSFSGLKTAVLRASQTLVGKDFTLPSHALPGLLSEAQKKDIAASFQRVALETVVSALSEAVDEFKPKSVAIAGGVAASQELRRLASEKLEQPVLYPDIKLCTDNASMIATLGYFRRDKHADPYSLEVEPNLKM